jgi:serine/threonine-protein kinase
VALFDKKTDSALKKEVPADWKVVDLGLLGKGGMCKVYRVRDETLEREVALKVLRPELKDDGSIWQGFVEEAKITAQLDHPNIPSVYALASASKKTTCFTMKVLEGMSMQDMLHREDLHGAEKLFAILEVLVRVCDAVAFAHEKGILHCDLKPQNIMVAAHGQIYVVDWGLARRKSELPKEAEDEGSPFGTPSYMAPEQARGQIFALDERTDVFALGTILYRVLVGRPPYDGKTWEETLAVAEQCRPVPIDEAAPKGSSLPRRLVAICQRAMATKPADRYQTVDDLKHDLEDFIRGTARLPEKMFKAGEAIVREGDVGECAYIILDGHCQANRQVAGKTQMLRLMGAGEMFGETAVLTGSPRLATVTALVDTTVAVVDRSVLEEEMERTSMMALAIRTVAASFLDLNGQTAALLQEQSAFKAVELVLRELALKGQKGAGDSRYVPWRALLGRLHEQTGLEIDVIEERVARQPGFQIDTLADRLTLRPVP